MFIFPGADSFMCGKIRFSWYWNENVSYVKTYSHFVYFGVLVRCGICSFILKLNMETRLLLIKGHIAVTSHELHSISDYWQLNCLLNSWLSLTTKKISKPCITGILWGETTNDNWILPQTIRSAKIIYISWCRHVWIEVDLFSIDWARSVDTNISVDMLI